MSLVDKAFAGVEPYISVTSFSDSNLYKLDKRIDKNLLSEHISAEDTLLQTKAGLDLGMSVSRQDFKLSGFVSKNSFNKNKHLNGLEKALSLTWGWTVGSHFNGVLLASYKDELSNFEDVIGIVKNTTTEKGIRFSGDWHYHPSWKIGVFTSRQDVTYGSNVQKNNREEKVDTLNWLYLARSGNNVGFKLSSVRDSKNEQKILSLTSLWKIGGKSKVTSSFGLVSKNNLGFVGENADFNADVSFDWRIMPKTLVLVKAYRRIDFNNFIFANYTENTGFSVSSIWSFSEKIALNINAEYEEKAFLDGVSESSVDTYNNYSLGLNYKIYRNINMGFSYRSSSRNSSRNLQDFESMSTNFNITINF